MRFLIGIVVFFFIILLGFSNFFTSIGSLELGWNVPSFIFVVIPSIAFAVCVTSWNTLKACFFAVFSSNAQITENDTKNIQLFLKAFGDTSILIGILATCIGFVLVGADPAQMNNFWPNMSVALLTTIYGVIIKIITHMAGIRVNYTQHSPTEFA